MQPIALSHYSIENRIVRSLNRKDNMELNRKKMKQVGVCMAPWTPQMVKEFKRKYTLYFRDGFIELWA